MFQYPKGPSQAVARVRRAVIETLEHRRLLAVVINEFLANNNTGIVDQDNDHSDWIELRNTGASSVNVSGWYLTDDAANLTKWQIPTTTTIPANGYLLVYASAKNRAVAGQQLHTNFHLDGDLGEYLALVQSNGTTIADSYNPFPPQDPDISYGRGATSTVTDTLIDEDVAVKAKVPTAASGIDSTWRNLSFVPDGTWLSGTTGIGFDTDTSGVNYLPYIGLNVQSQMSGVRNTIYTRYLFNVADPSVLSSLLLKMRYDDGIIVWLNGTEIPSARRNFDAGATPAWNSTTSNGATHPDNDAILYEDIDLTSGLGLLQPGQNVLAIHGLNLSTSSSDLLLDPLLTAVRSVATSASFMVTPTPGAGNSVGTLGFVADTNFSVDRGFFTSPFNVAITTSTPGAQIRYTLDGTAPTATTGTVYTAPINISTTRMLRAAAFKTGWTPTDVDTQTYIFLNSVIQQSGPGVTGLASWGNNGPDWEMDQTVVTNPTYSGTIVNDLQAVPSMSLVMPWADWFGPGGQGIYISGSGIERAGSVEMISANNSGEFQIDAALEIKGNSSTIRWNNDKLSIGVTFKPPFGPTKLNEVLFNDPTYDKGAAQSFDKIILDAVYDESWMSSSSTQRQRAKFIQDQVMADLQNLSGGHAPHGRYVQLYLNGMYWGLYYLHEVPDDSWGEEYLGGDKDDYDVIKHNSSTIVSGGNTNYNSLLSLVRQNMTVAANYNAVLAKLEIDEFIDYMIFNQYGGNQDWASQNWYASYNRNPAANGKWRFHSWDAEFTFRDPNVTNVDVTTKNDTGGPTEIHTRLSASPEYKIRFADHVQKLLRNGGLLTTASLQAIYNGRALQIDRAIVGESARWGDNHDEPAYTRANWRATQDLMLSNFIPNRGGVLLGQYSARGLQQSLVAPNFSQYGGNVATGYSLTMSKPSGSPAAAKIYYTLDGSDPRVLSSGSTAGGAISGSAIEYTGAITINTNRRVRARIWNSGSWSAEINVVFLTPTPFPLRISELHYHPPVTSGVVDSDDLEFIELINTGASPINLLGVQITGAIDTFTFPSINLAAGQRIVVARTPSVFDFYYGGGINRTTSGYTGKLDNAGEAIALLGPLGETLQSFAYDDNSPWPTPPDGDGPSLEIIDPLGNPADPANWRASAVDNGTPGSTATPPTVVASSFNFNTGHTITIQFSQDMNAASFATTDLTVQLQPGGPLVNPSSFSYDAPSRTVTFTFASILANGNYHATLAAGSVTNTGGMPLGGALDFDFFVLSGDANHDRKVDSADQAILTAHLNQAGGFSFGDFNYNGTVNSADQTILTAALATWLPAPGAVSLPATSGDDVYRIRRESATMLQVYAGAAPTPTYRIMLGAVTSLAFTGGTGNDTLTLDASNGQILDTVPFTFDASTGTADTVNVIGSTNAEPISYVGGSVTIGAMNVPVIGVEKRTFNGGGGNDSLSVDDSEVTLMANAALASLVVTNDARLDVRDRMLVLRSGNIGTWNGSAYTGITGMIQTGKGDGSWNGNGIVTTMTQATTGVTTTLAIATAGETGYAGGTFGGISVSATDVLVKYTWGGDADLNGELNGDDYFYLDSHVLQSGAVFGFHIGDFDYNGELNGDDYFILDSNILFAQGSPPFFSGAGVEFASLNHEEFDELV